MWFLEIGKKVWKKDENKKKGRKKLIKIGFDVNVVAFYSFDNFGRATQSDRKMQKSSFAAPSSNQIYYAGDKRKRGTSRKGLEAV